LIAAVAAAALLAATPACRATEIRQHDEAVFGHFASLAAARAYALKPRRLGFRGLKIENEGCGDFELEIDGADTQATRSSFAAEAARSGYQVTFEQRGEPLEPPPGEVVGVFGHFGTVRAANALAWRLAASGFRYIDVVPSGGSWLAVMPQVPVRSSLSIAREAARVHFRVQFRH
jgi:hypothetical protein